MEDTDSSNAAVLQDALHLHQQGLLDDAERIYRKLLASQPTDSTILHSLGVLCHQKGNVAEAIACFEKSLAQDPNSADTHFNLGAALHQQGKFEEAIDAYGQAIALEPANAAPHYNLGNALMALGRFEEAIAAYQTYLATEPANAGAQYNLGLALANSRQFEEAITTYRTAIKLQPQLLEAVVNLGTTLVEMRRSDEALAIYRQALKEAPNFIEAHYNLGNTLMGLGRFEEAETAFRHVLQQQPDFTMVHLRIADLKSFLAQDPDIAAMETKLAKPALSDQQAMHLCFALGKAYEDCEDYDRAFDHYARGNELKRATCTFDIAEEKAMTNRILNTFDKPFLTEHAVKGCASEKPIFIIGMPRSGASLIEQILASHSHVYGAGERKELAYHAHRLGASSEREFPETIRGLEAKDFERFGQTYVDSMTRLAPDAQCIADKWLYNFRIIGLIHLTFPNAKILHAMRNPFDTCLSCYKHLFDEERNFAYDLTELGRFYKLYERLMNHWRAVLPGRIFDVSYESLVEDPETVTRKVLDFCGLPWEAACLDFHKTERQVQIASVAQIRRPMTTKAVRHWRHYEHRLAPLFEALA